MADINRCDLSGIITAKEDKQGASFICLKQLVGGQFETEFKVLIAFKCDIEIGDEVLILNAIAYEKQGDFRFRIAGKDQIKILKKRLDLGVIEAKDEFI